MKYWMAGLALVIGAVLAVWALHDLKESGKARYHNNAFALKLSGYGTLLARLGQKNLDRAWHNGAVAGELSKHEHKEGDDHGDQKGLDKEGKGGKLHEENEDEHDHVEGDDDHGDQKGGGGTEKIEGALEFLVDLDAQRFRRTSLFSLSEEHRRAIALDIEKLLLRSYNMDPTDYGVYNSYFHFLVWHEMRGTPEARKHADAISEHTFRLALRETDSPMPWLTAAEAVLNQFLLAQQDLWRANPELVKKKSSAIQLPADDLIRYRDRMARCLDQYGKLKEKAIKEGWWSTISKDRRDEADDRAFTAGKMYEQFDAILKRSEKTLK